MPVAGQEAAGLWNVAITEGSVTPMTYYYLGWCLTQGKLSGAEQALADAAQACSDYCFPNRLEAILALQCAMEQNPNDAKAPYYLGNLYYDKRQYDLALEAWETSAKLDDKFPTIWRNLALANFNKKNEEARAIEYMERAFRLDTDRCACLDGTRSALQACPSFAQRAPSFPATIS